MIICDDFFSIPTRACVFVREEEGEYNFNGIIKAGSGDVGLNYDVAFSLINGYGCCVRVSEIL